jgi:4-amino-4-deoxy-L-arabinose transferase-like glycosyltransferase
MPQNTDTITERDVQPLADNSRWLRWDFALGTAVQHAYWWCFGAALALAGWNVLWRLGDTFVRDYDEGRYGVAASEMLHSHSMLVTTYAGATEFWNLKPALGYWLLDVSYLLVGETPLGLRLPAAVCGLLTTAVTMLLARRLAGPRASILAGVALATSFGFLGHYGARSGELDVPLTLLLLVFLVLAPRLFDSRPARLAAGLVLGLAFLLKSFAILPFVAAVAVYGVITRGMSSWRAWPLPAGIVLIMTATWAVARSVDEGSCEFVRRMFIEDLLLRSTTMIDPGKNRPWDYVGNLFDRLAPWPLIALLAWYLTRRMTMQQLRKDHAILLWCYALVPLVLFTLARTHHFHYILPTYPAWVILAGAGAFEVLKRAHSNGLGGPVAALILICMLACEARAIAHIEIRDRLPRSQIFLASLRPERGREDRLLHTTFTPSYSERFLLQVVDGFKLDEVPFTSLDPPADGLVLIKKSHTEWAPDLRGLPETAVLAQNDGYVFMRLADLESIGSTNPPSSCPQNSIRTEVSQRRGAPGITVCVPLIDSK